MKSSIGAVTLNCQCFNVSSVPNREMVARTTLLAVLQIMMLCFVCALMLDVEANKSPKARRNASEVK